MVRRLGAIGRVLTLEAVQRIMAAAEAEAERNGAKAELAPPFRLKRTRLASSRTPTGLRTLSEHCCVCSPGRSLRPSA
jgi:hypothetical protein